LGLGSIQRGVGMLYMGYMFRVLQGLILIDAVSSTY
jgi:hypothetical protein